MHSNDKDTQLIWEAYTDTTLEPNEGEKKRLLQHGIFTPELPERVTIIGGAGQHNKYIDMDVVGVVDNRKVYFHLKLEFDVDYEDDIQGDQVVGQVDYLSNCWPSEINLDHPEIEGTIDVTNNDEIKKYIETNVCDKIIDTTLIDLSTPREADPDAVSVQGIHIESPYE